MPRLPLHAFDRAYIERLIAEDPETERHFSKYFGDLLTLKLRARLRSPAQIDDVKQETFVRVLTTLKKKNGLENAATLGAFVNAVCNNILLETYRSGSRTTALDEGMDAPDERQPSAERTIMGAEEQARVREALAGLPSKERELLNALFFEEMAKDDVCRALKIDRNYLRVRLHRAKARFRERFNDGGTR